MVLQTHIWSLIEAELAVSGHSQAISPEELNPKKLNQLGGQVNAETQNAGREGGDIADWCDRSGPDIPTTWGMA